MGRPRSTAAFTAAIFALIYWLPGGAIAQNKLAGVYKGNGTPAALTQVVAYKGEPDSGQPVTVLVFSTKSQAGSSNPAFDALFNKFGDALVVKIDLGGKVLSLDLVHSKLDSPSGSIQVFGVLKMTDFKKAGGKISGHLTSGGPSTVRGPERDQTWQVDLTFETKAP
ncbi:MAG TPA: hypothetical protein VGI20_01470 [Rhizomicrobium sp.]|jgi:hypothetical protein